MSLRAALIALTSLAIAVSASPSLSLKVVGVTSIQNVENFKVKTILTNTGDETLKILNDPRGPLSSLPTDTFTITNAKGDKPSFTGIRVKYVPSTAIARGGYTVLAPGESIEVEHSLADAYNFSTPGEGSYEITANNVFYTIGSSSNIVPIHANHSNTAHRTNLSGRLFVPRLPHNSITPTKRQFWQGGCLPEQEAEIVIAVSIAQSLINSSISYLNSHTSSTPRFTTWFGTFTTARHQTVLNNFISIGSTPFSKYTYDCSCKDANTYAYSYPTQCGTIYLCGAFWNAPTTGTDSKAGTLVHEASHSTCNRGPGTQDYVYGQSGSKSLAISSPNQAIFNADSYEYFAENTPSLA
ncbi:hypothetical protein BJ165DRAFT_1609789 [Panaeolus papilionaceus]|nr:hypothetical protein BJ165DRAFT_1609789 [Panaeolus papilionaceus]